MRGPAETPRPAQDAFDDAVVDLVAVLMDAIEDLPRSGCGSITIRRTMGPEVYVTSSHDRVARAIRRVKETEGPATEEWKALDPENFEATAVVRW